MLCVIFSIKQSYDFNYISYLKSSEQLNNIYMKCINNTFKISGQFNTFPRTYQYNDQIPVIRSSGIVVKMFC